MENNQNNETANSVKTANNSWILIFLIFLLGGGGYYTYSQNQENDRIQNEMRIANEEMQRKTKKVELEKRKLELENQLEILAQKKSSLKTDFEVQNDKLDRAKEWQFMRTTEEREFEVSALSSNLRKIEQNIEYLDENIQKIKAQKNQVNSQLEIISK